jgi:hypothetical protein
MEDIIVIINIITETGLKKYRVRMWTGFFGLRLRTRDGLL